MISGTFVARANDPPAHGVLPRGRPRVVAVAYEPSPRGFSIPLRANIPIFAVVSGHFASIMIAVSRNIGPRRPYGAPGVVVTRPRPNPKVFPKGGAETLRPQPPRRPSSTRALEWDGNPDPAGRLLRGAVLVSPGFLTDESQYYGLVQVRKGERLGGGRGGCWRLGVGEGKEWRRSPIYRVYLAVQVTWYRVLLPHIRNSYPTRSIASLHPTSLLPHPP